MCFCNLGPFFHPHCNAESLSQIIKHVAEELERNIADGDPFTCPIYYCMSAKEFENNMDPVLQFSVCTLSKVISWCANVWQGYVISLFFCVSRLHL